ncbi:NUDIX domain-containing protein [Candidatus Dojkabacteria bacterium]|nr:NUDIX domain-containing protein [Candidatus Dojkabacteria bacterium]
MKNLHYIQMLILKELLFKPFSRFSDLNISGISSDHFAYHIKSLVELKLVVKETDLYKLTPKGKEFANTMDTERLKVEKQAKVGVLVIVEKYENNERYLLIQERLKEPYFGYKGFISGKIRFGETVLEAAQRELAEESGLEAELQHCYIIHELVYSKKGKLLEDKFFHVIKGVNPAGKLTSFDEGTNTWVLEDEFYNLEKKFYDEDYLLKMLDEDQKEFVSRKYVVEEF